MCLNALCDVSSLHCVHSLQPSVLAYMLCSAAATLRPVIAAHEKQSCQGFVSALFVCSPKSLHYSDDGWLCLPLSQMAKFGLFSTYIGYQDMHVQ